MTPAREKIFTCPPLTNALKAGFDRIVVHADCPDGLASAMILSNLWPDADVIFCKYNTEEHRGLVGDETQRTIFADFSPHVDTLDSHVHAETVVLDHHIHAKDSVDHMGYLGVYGENELVESGARLAGYVFEMLIGPDSAVEEFAVVAAIHDTWRKHDLLFNQACAQAAALMFYGPDMLLDDSRPPYLLLGELDTGRLLHRKRLEQAAKAGESAYIIPGWREGVKVAFVNDTQGLSSDIAEWLRNNRQVNVVVSYSLEATALSASLGAKHMACKFSLRSDGSVDVGAIAKSNGGGGHAAAAGFEMPATDIPTALFGAAVVLHIKKKGLS